MRNSFANAFYEIAKKDERIYLVVADITAAAGVASFQKESPERFINVGVAEQIMIGMAAGLALRGMIPFTYTIAPFTIYRPFEQVRVDCCYQNLPVKLVGVGAGVTYSTLGGTHHAFEDVAILSALPNMTIFAPCDPSEAAATTQATVATPGPVYLRLGKVGEPDLTKDAEPFVAGKIRRLKDGKDGVIFTYGPIAKMALDVAAKVAESKGIHLAVYGVPTLKPLDRSGIASVLRRYRQAYVVEEHVPHGGLSSWVKEIVVDDGINSRVKSYTLKDEFIHSYGSHADLLAAHGLSIDLISQGVIQCQS
jgi:transketolase